jgi:hypothetical protein
METVSEGVHKLRIDAEDMVRKAAAGHRCAASADRSVERR